MAQASRDFAQYIDDLIVHIADLQSGDVVSGVDTDALHQLHFPADPPTWAGTAPQHMERLGYGRDWSTFDGHTFKIEGGGLARAAQIRAERRKRTIRERVKGIPRSDWIAFAALIVSAIALFH